jgi:hypothetical protein
MGKLLGKKCCYKLLQLLYNKRRPALNGIFLGFLCSIKKVIISGGNPAITLLKRERHFWIILFMNPKNP